MKNYIEAPVLSCAEEIFKDKATGQSKAMYRIYLADIAGRVGSVYAAEPCHPGDVVRLGMAERDGKLRLRILRDK